MQEQGRGRLAWWADLRGGVQLAVGREGMTGGPRLGKENKEKENRFNSKFEADISNLFKLDSIQTGPSQT
jgi:hypothetical protein